MNISLARKPSQNVRDHLVSLQSPPYAPFEGNEYAQLCEEVTRLYDHARYGLKVCRYFKLLKYFWIFFQAEDGIRDCLLSRGLGDVYKRQEPAVVVQKVREYFLGEN